MDALILSCGTGGGHDAAAHALREAFERQGGRAVVLNPYTLCAGRAADSINKAYITLAQRCPNGFGVVYQLGNLYRHLPWRSPIYHLNRRMTPHMQAYLRKNHFDVVIATHLFAAEIMSQMKHCGMEAPPTLFVATDYTCIPFTEETDCDAYAIPAEALRGEYLRRGVAEEKIYPLGIPVRASFAAQTSREAARKALELDGEKRYLLVSGGSFGGGKLELMMHRLHAHCGDSADLIVICGSNERLYNRLRRRYGESARILKSTDKMAEYMRACNVYLTKPGGLSSTEAAVMGVPLVHLPPIPGCETKNARFFSEQGMSHRLRATGAGMERVTALLESEAERAAMRQCQHAVINPNAAEDICTLAAKLTGA